MFDWEDAFKKEQVKKKKEEVKLFATYLIETVTPQQEVTVRFNYDLDWDNIDVDRLNRTLQNSTGNMTTTSKHSNVRF